jgi:iron complex outermembrane receptor protein
LASAYTVAIVAAPLVLGVAPAFAQSTGTQEVETVVVTGVKASQVSGLFVQQDIAKTRSVINTDFISTQIEGQSIVAEANLLPGVSINNNDPYGASGGDIRLRGYPNNKISVTIDGIPLNDTGNYAIYIGEYMDAEIVDHLTVNSGTTDVDSPTASATGGTINIVTKIPDDVASLNSSASYGSFDFRHFSLIGQTGEIGPWGTKAYLQMSYMDYDKFKGYGALVRRQANARIYQDLGGGDFISLAADWDPNNNYSYQSNSKATIFAAWAAGTRADYAATCTRTAGTNGHADVEASCSNYFGARINPSHSGNIRGQSLFTLTDNLKLSVDPSLQFVLADGGAQDTVVSESDPRLIGGSAATGVDLNGDGDTLDKVNIMMPSVTETRRWGLTTSLLWTPLEKSLVQFSYTLDYGLHRQTGVSGYMTPGTNPVFEDNYGGIHNGHYAATADGGILRYRDRKSKAILNQASADYEGDFFDDMLHVSVGVRAPFFERDLDQRCYTTEKAGTGGAGGPTFSPGATPYCTTQTPNYVVLTAGNPQNLQPGTYVKFTGGTAYFDAPYKATRDYNRILPNVGLSLKPWGDEHQFYVAFADTMSAPITDDLYVTPRIAVQPETATAYDIGYRYTGPDGLIASIDAWHSIFNNHIVSSYDQDTGYNTDRNVGPVLLSGVDLTVGAQPIDNLSLYGTASWETSKLKDDLNVSGVIIHTAGKQLVETPDWMFSSRAQYKIAGFTIGVQGKYTGRRFASDLNDEQTSPYMVFDSDISYDLGQIGWDNAELKFNVTNLLDKKYLGGISSTNTAAGVPFYYEGAPRTFQGTIKIGL